MTEATLTDEVLDALKTLTHEETHEFLGWLAGAQAPTMKHELERYKATLHRAKTN